MQRRGLRIGTRMLLIYILGGLLPMVLLCTYLMRSTAGILIRRAEESELTVLETMQRQLSESLNTMASVSQYFYFDEQLETIAFREYESYQDIVADYRGYTAFQTYTNYYSNIINWVSIYIDNPTISSNTRFIQTNDACRSQDWYQRALTAEGSVVWDYRPAVAGGSDVLCLSRLVRTTEKRQVGILVIELRGDRLKEITAERNTPTYLMLNGSSLLYSNDSSAMPEEVRSLLSQHASQGISDGVEFQGQICTMASVEVDMPESGDTLQIVSLQPRTEILQAASTQNIRSFLFAFAAVALSLVLIGLFSRSFSRRIERFRVQMQKASKGDFALEKHLGGKDEISELYEYLGIMIDDIQRLITQVYEEQLKKEKLKASQRNAEFKMLASQINPHFLYNTLEVIRMKARKNGETEIAELVRMLAKILRYNLQVSNREVTVGEELQVLEAYLKIQSCRFGSRIQYTILAAESARNKLILPLLMQPLVENSIGHGLEGKLGDGHLLIQIEESGKNLCVTVEDDGMGIPPERLAELRHEMEHPENLDRSHIGICNVHQRIRLQYGNQYGLQLESVSDQGTKIVFDIPARSAEEG